MAPFYDYLCCDCGHKQEILTSISEHDKHSKEEELPVCESCVDGFLLPQVNKGTTFQLIGKGWFRDSYS